MKKSLTLEEFEKYRIYDQPSYLLTLYKYYDLNGKKVSVEKPLIGRQKLTVWRNSGTKIDQGFDEYIQHNENTIPNNYKAIEEFLNKELTGKRTIKRFMD